MSDEMIQGGVAGVAVIKKTKLILLCILGGVGLLGLGFATGRYAAPDKVVVSEKIKVVETEKVVTVEKVRVERVVVSDEKKKVHTEEYQVKHPDGTEEKKTTTDENVDTVVHEQDTKYVDRWNERIVEKEVYRDREKTVYRDRPQWSLGVGAGFSIPEATGSKAGYRLLDPLGPVILQADVNRRILGPISAGVWGNTSGVVGVGLKLDF